MSGNVNKNRRFACETGQKTLQNRTGRNEVAASSGPNQSEPMREVRAMADASQYPDSAGKINSNNSGTWKPIGALAAKLVEAARK